MVIVSSVRTLGPCNNLLIYNSDLKSWKMNRKKNGKMERLNFENLWFARRKKNFYFTLDLS